MVNYVIKETVTEVKINSDGKLEKFNIVDTEKGLKKVFVILTIIIIIFLNSCVSTGWVEYVDGQLVIYNSNEKKNCRRL